MKTLCGWRKNQSLPPNVEVEFKTILHQQWQKHVQLLKAERRLTWRGVTAARGLLHKEFVVHCEDHEPNHLMVYCPQFYVRAALKTWQGPDVFEEVSGSQEQWNQWVLDRIPGKLQRRYCWGINVKGSLPEGFAFLKRQKELFER